MIAHTHTPISSVDHTPCGVRWCCLYVEEQKIGAWNRCPKKLSHHKLRSVCISMHTYILYTRSFLVKSVATNYRGFLKLWTMGCHSLPICFCYKHSGRSIGVASILSKHVIATDKTFIIQSMFSPFWRMTTLCVFTQPLRRGKAKAAIPFFRLAKDPFLILCHIHITSKKRIFLVHINIP